jgi:hypothetical protein
MIVSGIQKHPTPKKLSDDGKKGDDRRMSDRKPILILVEKCESPKLVRSAGRAIHLLQLGDPQSYVMKALDRRSDPRQLLRNVKN